MFSVVTFYKFQDLKNPDEMKRKLLSLCENIKGTILLANEGINSTIAGPKEDIETLVCFLDSEFPNMPYKYSHSEKMPFYRLKIRIKKEIVTMRKPEANPAKLGGAEYVKPLDWNKLISDPDTILIDVRNDYEFDIGTFKGAIDPKTKSFSEFPDYIEKNLLDKKDKKIAMMCTGGIRVEKASAYLKYLGFEKIYQLEGGILKYLEDVPKEESLWEGECFVFDQRVTLEHNVIQGNFKLCSGCRHPLSTEDMESDCYEKGVSCPHCFDKTTEEQKRRFRDRQRQINLAQAKGVCHIGPRHI